MNRNGHGFTLVELLVVIAIIAVMTSLLMPALAGSRTQAKMLVELSASRQLGQAYLAYALESDGRLMPGHFKNTGTVLDDQGQPLSPAEAANRWPWRLMQYIDYGMEGSLLVNEQATALADRADSMWAYDVSLYPSFGLNMGNLGGDLLAAHRTMPGCLTRLAESVNPSRMVVFSSAGSPAAFGTRHGYWRIVAPTQPYEGGAAGWTDVPYRYPESGPPGQWGYVHPRWNDRAAVAHLDGHSEMLSMEQMRDMTRWSNRAAIAADPNWKP